MLIPAPLVFSICIIFVHVRLRGSYFLFERWFFGLQYVKEPSETALEDMLVKPSSRKGQNRSRSEEGKGGIPLEVHAIRREFFHQARPLYPEFDNFMALSMSFFLSYLVFGAVRCAWGASGWTNGGVYVGLCVVTIATYELLHIVVAMTGMKGIELKLGIVLGAAGVLVAALVLVDSTKTNSLFDFGLREGLTDLHREIKRDLLQRNPELTELPLLHGPWLAFLSLVAGILTFASVFPALRGSRLLALSLTKSQSDILYAAPTWRLAWMNMELLFAAVTAALFHVNVSRDLVHVFSSIGIQIPTESLPSIRLYLILACGLSQVASSRGRVQDFLFTASQPVSRMILQSKAPSGTLQVDSPPVVQRKVFAIHMHTLTMALLFLAPPVALLTLCFMALEYHPRQLICRSPLPGPQPQLNFFNTSPLHNAQTFISSSLTFLAWWLLINGVILFLVALLAERFLAPTQTVIPSKKD